MPENEKPPAMRVDVYWYFECKKSVRNQKIITEYTVKKGGDRYDKEKEVLP